MRRVKRCQITVALVVLLLCTASLLFTSRKESRWHVSLDLTNWRVYGSKSVEFDPAVRCYGALKAITWGRL